MEDGQVLCPVEDGVDLSLGQYWLRRGSQCQQWLAVKLSEGGRVGGGGRREGGREGGGRVGEREGKEGRE